MKVTIDAEAKLATIVGFSIGRNYIWWVLDFGMPDDVLKQRARINGNALLDSNVGEAKEIRWVLALITPDDETLRSISCLLA